MQSSPGRQNEFMKFLRERSIALLFNVLSMFPTVAAISKKVVAANVSVAFNSACGTVIRSCFQ